MKKRYYQEFDFIPDTDTYTIKLKKIGGRNNKCKIIGDSTRIQLLKKLLIDQIKLKNYNGTYASRKLSEIVPHHKLFYLFFIKNTSNKYFKFVTPNIKEKRNRSNLSEEFNKSDIVNRRWDEYIFDDLSLVFFIESNSPKIQQITCRETKYYFIFNWKLADSNKYKDLNIQDPTVKIGKSDEHDFHFLYRILLPDGKPAPAHEWKYIKNKELYLSKFELPKSKLIIRFGVLDESFNASYYNYGIDNDNPIFLTGLQKGIKIFSINDYEKACSRGKKK